MKLPGHNMVDPFEAVIVAGGFGFVFIVTTTGVELPEHPDALKAVTVYVPAVFTVIDCAVCPPGDHWYVVPPEAVSVTDSPAFNAVGPLAEIEATIAVDSVTPVTGEVEEQPEALVTFTE